MKFMKLLFQPQDIKMKIETIKTNASIQLPGEKEKITKESLFYEITLTHIALDISAYAEGYNKLEVMANCLQKLNEYIIANDYLECMPFDNMEIIHTEINK